MKGFIQDIEGVAVKNEEFRRVIYTAKSCQLVVMALKPKEEIGMESAQARSVLSRGGRDGRGRSQWSSHGDQRGLRRARPCGDETQHHQYGQCPLKLYTLYAPPNHRDGCCPPYPRRSREG